jgi:hypothetical protein
LVSETEPNHPGGQLDRIGNSRVARASVEIQKLSRQIADQTRRVVRALNDLHDVSHSTLKQFDKLARRRGPQG